MPTMVTNHQGHEVQVVDQNDLLQAERYLRNWILTAVGGLILAAISATVIIVTMRNHLDNLADSVQQLQVNGSEAVRKLQIDVAVIRTQQDVLAITLEQNRIVLLDIMDILSKR